MKLLNRHHDPAPSEAAIPVAVSRPRGVEPTRLGCKPGDSRRVLDDLRFADVAMAAVVLDAARTARPVVESEASAHRAAELMADHVTAIRAMVDAAPYVRHEDAVQLMLAPLAAMLSEVS